MRTNNAVATKYQHSQVTHADPVQVIVMLYDGALSRISQARQRLEKRNFLQAGLAVTKALAIVGELRKSLNMDAGGEIAASLDQLYVYLHELLVKATIENRTEPLDEATRLLNELRTAWAEVARQVKELTENDRGLALNPAGAKPEASRVQVKA
jgi:flagellar secretion chaperone FliS